MSIKITYDEKQLRRIRERLEGMQARSKDAAPAWEAVLQWFADRNFQQFLSRGAEYGTRWAPLKPETIAEKARLGYPHDPLIRTGNLVHSITLRPLGIEQISAREMTGGTDVGYAPYQHRGTDRIPARPLFSATEIKASKAVTHAIANWIIDGVRSVRPRKRR